MMNGFDFKTFWFKYRNLILGGLFFLMLINFCGRRPAPQPSPEPVSPPRQEQVQEGSLPEDENALKSYEEILRSREAMREERPGSTIVWLLVLGVVAFLVWQYGAVWQKRWFPGKVRFKVVRLRDHQTGRRLLRFSLSNGTRDSQTFMPPLVVFKKWATRRQFKLKGSNQEDMFPLTLTPGTSHNVVIDLDQFFEKMPELKNFNRVGGTVRTTADQEFRSFTPPLWLGF